MNSRVPQLTETPERLKEMEAALKAAKATLRGVERVLDKLISPVDEQGAKELGTADFQEFLRVRERFENVKINIRRVHREIHECVVIAPITGFLESLPEVARAFPPFFTQDKHGEIVMTIIPFDLQGIETDEIDRHAEVVIINNGEIRIETNGTELPLLRKFLAVTERFIESSDGLPLPYGYTAS